MLNVTVQKVEPAAPIEVGVHVRELRLVADTPSVKLIVLVVPLSVAIKVAIPSSVPLLAAENCAVVEPAVTVTFAGIERAMLKVLSATVVATGAGPLNVTVQDVVVAPPIEVGVQVSEVSVGGTAVSVKLAVCEAPARVAVNIAVPVTVPLTVTEN